MERLIEDISRQYDEAYYKAQALFDEYNPCQMKVHSRGKLTCTAYHTPGPLCCPGCDYHSYDGCTVECLGCKISLCGNAGEHDEFREKLWAIRKTLPSYPISLLRIRQSKEVIMNEVAWDIRRTLLWTPERRIAWNALDVPGM
jgi:hypothetical protein